MLFESEQSWSYNSRSIFWLLSNNHLYIERCLYLAAAPLQYSRLNLMKRQAEYDFEDEPLSKATKNGDGSLKKHSQGELHHYIRDEKLINLLLKKGVKSLFPIQYLTFRHIECGKDIIARDKTGSGKTLAFSLPIIQKMR